MPLPTFLVPEGSKGGPPAAGTAAAGVVAGLAAGVSAGLATGTDSLAVLGVEPLPNPQPSLPCWNAAPGPEQMPVGNAQQPLAQSALVRHCPVINCLPAALPTFAAPAGSKGGTATTVEARVKRVATMMETVFIMMMF